MSEQMAMVKMRSSQRRGPFAKIKFGSFELPIYRSAVRGRPRYTLAFYNESRRIRRTFSSLDAAIEEGKTIARKLDEGLAHPYEMRAYEREIYLAAKKILEPLDIPLLTAIEEYVEVRRSLGGRPLLSAVEDFAHRWGNLKFGAKVPAIVEEFLKAKKQDRISDCYQKQLRYTMNHFAAAFPGELYCITSGEIDKWLRGLRVSPVTRNSTLRILRAFFSFSKLRSYLPRSDLSAAEALPMLKTGAPETEIFKSDVMTKILLAAPRHLIPLLAIGAFAGLRAAEIARIDWSAFDFERHIIELRAGQAKTASRRIVPMADNLVRWLSLAPHDGKVLANRDHFRQMRLLAHQLGVGWPHNVLRHSYISYRLALVKDANQVALEAGNSPAMIFRHYRELVTEDAAKEWFSIRPSDDWEPPLPKRSRRSRKPKSADPAAASALLRNEVRRSDGLPIEPETTPA